MPAYPILIAGQWRETRSAGTFHAENPATGEKLPDEYPTSAWADCDEALDAAREAAKELRTVSPERIAEFLIRYAERIEARKNEIVQTAHLETALAKAPRLVDVELPRTTGQLRQAAAAAREGSWAMPTIDAKINLRSQFEPLGLVCVFGPNNFPFAYNGVAGGDFAAAIAAGNPVLAKAHPCHPGTTRLLAEEANAAVRETDLPPATVQMIYNLQPEDGLRLVADRRLGAAAFTGSRAAGMKLKAAADAAGKPIYLEMSSLNPVVILPGALAERAERVVDDFVGSCLLAGGQMCTKPGIVVLFAGPETERFIAAVKDRFQAAPAVPLLSAGVVRGLEVNINVLRGAGAQIVTGGAIPTPGQPCANTLLRVSGDAFLTEPERLQTEAFGNASLIVVVKDLAQAVVTIEQFEGNLTASIYSDTHGGDDALYEKLSPLLRLRAGRLLNDKMPTGVAVSAAMNHGGPYPASGHPGFTAVGIPAAMRRFAMLACYDNVRADRLPASLRDNNSKGRPWRLIDGKWSREDIEQ